MPQIQSKKIVFPPYTQLSPIYQGSTRASWWKKCTSNWNVNRINNYKHWSVCLCVQKPWERHVPRKTRRISESFATMLPVFIFRRVLICFVVITCFIVLLVYVFQSQITMKEDYTDGNQVTNTKKYILLHLEVSNLPYFIHGVWWK
jgi:hypothetical protein